MTTHGCERANSAAHLVPWSLLLDIYHQFLGSFVMVFIIEWLVFSKLNNRDGIQNHYLLFQTKSLKRLHREDTSHEQWDKTLQRSGNTFAKHGHNRYSCPVKSYNYAAVLRNETNCYASCSIWRQHREAPLASIILQIHHERDEAALMH